MDIQERWGIDPNLWALAWEVEQALEKEGIWPRIRQIRETNQLRLLHAFREAKISEAGFNYPTGYGYDDLGRERLEQAFAALMGAEQALLRVQLSSGTEALATALFGVLRPGDFILSLTGLPYDTLYATIGLDAEGRSCRSADNQGSLADFGIGFEQLPLLDSGELDMQGFEAWLEARRAAGLSLPRLLYFQRSRGYSGRRALLRADLQPALARCHQLLPEAICFVDNCYGEFTDTEEPGHWGADLMAGSLIKNPGGGLAPSGGYICGRADLVQQAAGRMTAPGVGAEIGPSLGFNRILTQGLYLAPHVVGECLLGLTFAARFCEELGFATAPLAEERRGDIIQTFCFPTAEAMVQFCQSVQAASPVDSFARPLPAPLPGYRDEVIMAAGTFVQGASIELSADGPVCPPYRVYVQGGLVYEQLKLAFLLALGQSGPYAS